jgi:hypothetical protein
MNPELVVQVCLFVLGILAAIFFIPREIRRLEERRNEELVKGLLREWGRDCEAAITVIMPAGSKKFVIKEDGGIVESSDGVGIDAIIVGVWQEIIEGRRVPDGLGSIIDSAVQKTILSDEEGEGKGSGVEQVYLLRGDVPKAFVSRVLNPMYAKLEIFDLKLLPIHELELVMDYLESFRQRGTMTRYKLVSYVHHLGESMEKFGKYLWRLEKWGE